jgi:hypothetical protein
VYEEQRCGQGVNKQLSIAQQRIAGCQCACQVPITGMWHSRPVPTQSKHCLRVAQEGLLRKNNKLANEQKQQAESGLMGEHTRAGNACPIKELGGW